MMSTLNACQSTTSAFGIMTLCFVPLFLLWSKCTLFQSLHCNRNMELFTHPQLRNGQPNEIHLSRKRIEDTKKRWSALGMAVSSVKKKTKYDEHLECLSIKYFCIWNNDFLFCSFVPSLVQMHTFSITAL